MLYLLNDCFRFYSFSCFSLLPNFMIIGRREQIYVYTFTHSQDPMAIAKQLLGQRSARIQDRFLSFWNICLIKSLLKAFNIITFAQFFELAQTYRNMKCSKGKFLLHKDVGDIYVAMYYNAAGLKVATPFYHKDISRLGSLLSSQRLSQWLSGNSHLGTPGLLSCSIASISLNFEHPLLRFLLNESVAKGL